MAQYFSEREFGTRPRTVNQISSVVWQGIAHLIEECVGNGSFGRRFPETCQDYPFDSNVCCGANVTRLEVGLKTEIPELADMEQRWRDSESTPVFGYPTTYRKDLWRLSGIEQPPLPVIMDIIEFCWSSIGKPERVHYHSFFQHYHLKFDQRAGQSEFMEQVNRIFGRNGLAFTLTPEGIIERIIPGPVGDVLHSVEFLTGDFELDELLETARRKILLPDDIEHRDALEKLWDAWERLKTIEDKDKRRGITKVLDKTVGPNQPKLRDFVDAEAKALTEAGNSLRIRHSETIQERLVSTDQVDYLFQRLFSLIYFILNKMGRITRYTQPDTNENNVAQSDEDLPF